MGWACGTYGREERCIKGFGGEKDHLGEVFIDGRTIFKNIKDEGWGHGLD
jgi:hypothetical protein